MGVGPSSPEEAWAVWDDLSVKQKSLEDVMQEIATNPLSKDSFLERLTAGIELPLDEDSVLTRAVREKQMFNIIDAKADLGLEHLAAAVDAVALKRPCP